MKGAIKSGHMPVNLYRWQVLGLPPLTPISVSGIEEELEVTELPDRTVASGGQTKPVEFTVVIPMHHTVEVTAMEAWFKESQHPVTSTYKKTATLVHKPVSGGLGRAYQQFGVFPVKRKTSDLEMENEGEMAVVEWTMRADKVTPLT